MIQRLLNWLGYGDQLLGARSSQWPATKRAFEKIEPKKCAVCGKGRVQLHHIQSFASKPELENDLTNLVWLCEGVLTNHHHLWWGHLGNFQSLNQNLMQWIEAVKTRPKWDGKEWKKIAQRPK